MMNYLLLGASGFVGRSLRDAMRISVLSQFSRGHLVSSRLSDQSEDSSSWKAWDVTEHCSLEPVFGLIVHAATPASALLNAEDPEAMFRQNVLAMSNVIDFASRHEKPPIVLFTSSGAVYGDMPTSIDCFPEDWAVTTVSQDVASAYARGKIEAELMLKEATNEGKCVGLTARMFAFSGVHLPIDRHFAIGNFVRDVVNSGTITIRSDGSSIRSYMDGEDMANWLLRVIEAGVPDEIYHIGSERSISIRDLATLVVSRYELITGNEASIEVLGQSSPIDGVSRYVPSTQITREKLGLRETVSLESSIDQMIIKAKNSL